MPLQLLWNFIREINMRTASTVTIGLFLPRIQSSGEISTGRSLEAYARCRRDTFSLLQGNLDARLLLRDESADLDTSCHPCFKNADPPHSRGLCPFLSSERCPFSWRRTSDATKKS